MEKSPTVALLFVQAVVILFLHKTCHVHDTPTAATAATAATASPLFESRSFQFLHSADPVEFVVFGGSETAGTECSDTSPSTCCWSYKVHQRFPNSRFHNMARGGTTSISIAPLMGYIVNEIQLDTTHHKPVFLLDFSINDVFETTDVGLVIKSMNTIIATIRAVVGHNVVIVGITMPLKSPRNVQMYNAYDYVFKTNNVPQIKLNHLGEQFWTWKSNVHPPKEGHDYFADVIFKSLVNKPFAIERHEGAVDSCQFLSFYSAFYNTSIGGNCGLYEDRKNKPGYICEHDEELNGVLDFGKEPKMVVTYLSSYSDAIDDFVMVINGEELYFNTTRDDHVSMSSTKFMLVAGKSNQSRRKHVQGLYGANIKPFSKNVSFVVRKEHVDSPSKIKLLSIGSC